MCVSCKQISNMLLLSEFELLMSQYLVVSRETTLCFRMCVLKYTMKLKKMSLCNGFNECTYEHVIKFVHSFKHMDVHLMLQVFEM